MRKLIYIPNVHPPENMLEGGRMVLSTEPKLFETIDVASKRIWSLIEQSVDQLKINLCVTKVFAEGVFCSEQVEALKEDGLGRSSNQQQAPISPYDEFLIRLLGKGVDIVPAENYQVYMWQIAWVGRVVAIYNEIEESEDPDETLDKFNSEIWSLIEATHKTMEERDKFIAEKINTVLKNGETGILIIGAAHKVQDFLDEDIGVECINQEILREISDFYETSGQETSQLSNVFGRKLRERSPQWLCREREG
jgi:pheromone shutdown protein TraB